MIACCLGEIENAIYLLRKELGVEEGSSNSGKEADEMNMNDEDIQMPEKETEPKEVEAPGTNEQGAN